MEKGAMKFMKTQLRQTFSSMQFKDNTCHILKYQTLRSYMYAKEDNNGSKSRKDKP